MNYERYKAVRGHVRLSKDWTRFVPSVSFDGREGESWEAVKAIDAGTRGAVRAMLDYKARLDASEDYTPEGKQRKLEAYYREEIAPKLESARKSALSEYRKRAKAAFSEASERAFELPEHPYLIALEIEDLRAVKAGLQAKGKAKLTLPELEALPFETRRVMALARPIASGLRPEVHEKLRRQFLEEAGGHELAEAEALVNAVEATSEVIDYAEIACEQAVGLERSHPLAEAGREFREEKDIPEPEPLLATGSQKSEASN